MDGSLLFARRAMSRNRAGWMYYVSSYCSHLVMGLIHWPAKYQMARNLCQEFQKRKFRSLSCFSAYTLKNSSCADSDGMIVSASRRLILQPKIDRSITDTAIAATACSIFIIPMAFTDLVPLDWRHCLRCPDHLWLVFISLLTGSVSWHNSVFSHGFGVHEWNVRLATLFKLTDVKSSMHSWLVSDWPSISI